MKKFKQIIAGLLCTAGLLGATASLAAGGGDVKWDKAPVDVSASDAFDQLESVVMGEVEVRRGR